MNVVWHDNITQRCGSIFVVEKIDAFADGQFTDFHL